MQHETLNSLRALLDGTVRVGDDDMSVAGAWIDVEARAVRYVGLDVAGWLGGHVALVPAERLARWSDGLTTGWRAEVDREEVEADEARLEESSGPLDLTALPPIVTGPFGNTVSPMLMAVGLMSEGREEAPPHPPGAEAAAPEAPRDRARALDRAHDWLDAPIAARLDVIGRGAEAGPEIVDLLIDPDGMRLDRAVIASGGTWRAVPMDRLGERGRDGVVPVALTRAEIDAMPEVVSPSQARDP